MLDANLLCLLVAGLTDVNLIGKHRRLQAYEEADYDRLDAIAGMFSQVIVCPHVLAEASNLLSYGTERAEAERLHASLGQLLDEVEEQWRPAIEVRSAPEYLRLGLTDAVLLALSAGRSVLLSADAALCVAVERRGGKAINYSHVREGAWSMEQIAAYAR